MTTSDQKASVVVKVWQNSRPDEALSMVAAAIDKLIDAAVSDALADARKLYDEQLRTERARWAACQQKAIEEALAEQRGKHIREISNLHDDASSSLNTIRDEQRRLREQLLAAERLRGEQALSACQSGVEERIEAAVRSEREACAKVAADRAERIFQENARARGWIGGGGWTASDIADAIHQRASPTDLPAPPADAETGVAMISAERRRQIDKEVWTPDHDDQHTKGELAEAAACYATARTYVISSFWPWDKSWWKPSSPIRNLVKAGALIAAEIDRLQRAKSPAPPDSPEERPQPIPCASAKHGKPRPDGVYYFESRGRNGEGGIGSYHCENCAKTLAFTGGRLDLDWGTIRRVDGKPDTLGICDPPPDSKPTPQKRHDCLPLHNGSADECDYCRHLGNTAYRPWEHGKFVESGWVPVPFVVGQF